VPPPIPLRAHNLLCLVGYRGRGYDDAFVARMSAVHAALTRDPATLVEVRTGPDTLCDACPNLHLGKGPSASEGGGGCTLGEPDHEPHMRAQDEDVARRLGLAAGQVVTWAEILARVADRLRGRDLPGICTTCPWLPLGWCAEGIDRLRERRPPSPIPSS